MYCILLEFRPTPGTEEDFLGAWREFTAFIFENYGSKGSRMHLSEDGRFIAYAQWPDKNVYENVVETEAGNKLRKKMTSFLQEDGVTVIEKLEVLEDLLAR